MKYEKLAFHTFFTILLLYIGLLLFENVIKERSDTRVILDIIYYFDTLLISILIPALLAYLIHCCGESPWRSRLFHLEIALWAGLFIMLNMTPFTSLFYYHSQENQFCRGPLYRLMTAFLFAMTLLILGGVIHWRSRLSEKYYHSFLVSLGPMTLAIFLHFFISAFSIFSFCVIICASSMYIIILADQIQQDLIHQREIARQQGEIARQQREIAQQRADIMVLQMRPHFIYNTMTSIYCLCSQNPEKAQKVVMDFTTYLRKNFTAVASTAPIPFTSELEHTRAYLDVEQAQYAKSLSVDYDTKHTFFRLPPLTLQPIVENAVKHGRDPNSSPLHISIRTRKTDSGSEITVSDNGRGFQPADDSDGHIALNNIRQRLEMMCKGSLTIMPKDGGGTVVTVTIPDSASE